MNSCIVIMECLHTERPGFFRAFAANDPEASGVCTLYGYASGNHSFRTIRETVLDARRLDKTSDIYRAFRDGRASRLIEKVKTESAAK